jgi:hypothetical protein
MGEVVSFGGRRTENNGIVHVWKTSDGGYEIGQESRSGNSWGSFDQFDTAQEAVAAAYRLNAEVYDGACEVFINEDVLADIPATPGPATGEW